MAMPDAGLSELRASYSWAAASTTARSIIAVQAACFMVGAASHVGDLLGSGQPYPGYPLALRLFWLMLLPIDVLLVWALFARTLPAVVMAALVMLVDVGANTYATVRVLESDFARSPGLWRQSALLVFILGSAPLLLRDARAARARVTQAEDHARPTPHARSPH